MQIYTNVDEMCHKTFYILKNYYKLLKEIHGSQKY